MRVAALLPLNANDVILHLERRLVPLYRMTLPSFACCRGCCPILPRALASIFTILSWGGPVHQRRPPR